MRQGLGALFVAGWTLDEVLWLTWDQLGVVVSCMAEYRALQINTLGEIVSSAFGGSVESPTTSRARAPARRRRGKRKPQPDLAARFAAAGIPVSTE